MAVQTDCSSSDLRLGRSRCRRWVDWIRAWRRGGQSRPTRVEPAPAGEPRSSRTARAPLDHRARVASGTRAGDTGSGPGTVALGRLGDGEHVEDEKDAEGEGEGDGEKPLRPAARTQPARSGLAALFLEPAPLVDRTRRVERPLAPDEMPVLADTHTHAAGADAAVRELTPPAPFLGHLAVPEPASPVRASGAPGASAGPSRLVGRRAVRRPAAWALWTLPTRVLRRVLLVEAVWAGLIAVCLRRTTFRAEDLVAFGALVTLATLAVWVARRMGGLGGAAGPAGAAGAAGAGIGRPGGHRDLLAIWTLPIALLLAPFYALVVHAPLCLLTRTAGTARMWHRRIFDVAALGIAGCAASWLHVTMNPPDGAYTTPTLVGTFGRLGAVLLAVGAYVLCRRLLLAERTFVDRRLGTSPCVAPGTSAEVMSGLPVGSSTDPRLGGRRRRREAIAVESAEMCSAVAVAALWAANPLLMLAATPPALLLQRSLSHDELLVAARTDAKTRLANAAWWREVAEQELARTRRAGRPLSVLLVDIDHFKLVNDEHGHLVGDAVLLAVADALRAATRPWDLIGRFGGEEFVVLLAEVDLRTAAHVAERIRRQVAATRCRLEERAPIAVTVSVGVAMSVPGCALAAVLAAADAALYRAKADGRDLVRIAPMVPTQIPPAV